MGSEVGRRSSDMAVAAGMGWMADVESRGGLRREDGIQEMQGEGGEVAWDGVRGRSDVEEEETGGDTKIPDLWRMAALMKMCPKEIRKMIDLSWDSIDEKYNVMRDKVMTWAVNKAEEGGPVPMDAGDVVPEEGWRMVNEWNLIP